MQTRRQAIKHTAATAAFIAGAGMLPMQAFAFNKGAFDAKSMQDALKALGATSAMSESKDVVLTAPDIAENGAVVPLAVSSSLPGIKHLALLVEKNPAALVAMFNVNESVEPNFATRAKMGQTSDVYAVAITNDGKALFSKKEVKVTLGGCGG